jgi:lipopolysaccharide export LptBFGC system permease protein LptF
MSSRANDVVPMLAERGRRLSTEEPRYHLPMRVLDRACLKEAGLNFVFYGLGYLGLIAVLLCAPLLKQGAPLLAVLSFLPDNLMFISMLSLPLAMVTAMLATIGRMREDGEITALMAAGVSSFRIALALLPLAVLLAVWLGIAAHVILPHVAKRLIEGRADLANPAARAQIARHRPIYQTQGDQDIVSAVGVDGDLLQQLFAVHFDRPSDPKSPILVVYAPQARFVTDPMVLRSLESQTVASSDTKELPMKSVGALELRQAWMVRAQPGDPSPDAPVTTGTFPYFPMMLLDHQQNLSDMQDAFSTGKLLEMIRDTKITDENRGYVRGLERAWHTRWMIPCAVFIYWAFAIGLGLLLGRSNRLLSIFLGLLTVVATLIPGFGVVKSLGPSLMFDAGWLLWPPVLLLGLAGAWLLWRLR